jgi:O-acetylhomoserine (thiol)-lyase
MVFTDTCGPAAFITRARVVPLRNMGGALSPMNSFQILQGIESLAVRMDRHCSNALAVAEFLEKHESVSWVNYPGLKSHPDNPLVEKYMNGKASSVMSFGIKGGIKAGGKFIDKLNLIVRLVNIGDAKSLACHPASTTHRQLNKDELEAAGVPEDMIRLSIGIEHIDDIIEDLAQALK